MSTSGNADAANQRQPDHEPNLLPGALVVAVAALLAPSFVDGADARQEITVYANSVAEADGLVTEDLRQQGGAHGGPTTQTRPAFEVNRRIGHCAADLGTSAVSITEIP